MSEPEYSDENTPKRDYKALIEEVRERADGCGHAIIRDARELDLANMFTLAADAIEALQAENELGERGLRIAAHRIFELRQERDALQDRLDAIRKYVSRVPFPKPDKILAILDPVEVKEEDK